ncbi:hypothetical protein BTW32_25955 [Bacillus thuringiensis]|nr:hypothetical protein BTW32_25955 [Bacillus thuringiensis]
MVGMKMSPKEYNNNKETDLCTSISKNEEKFEKIKALKKIPTLNAGLESDAFSLSSFTRGSVDPRTGSYNFTLPLASIKGNSQRGPQLNLNLAYNHFSSVSEGLGIGWSLGLSKFNKETKRVSLRDGRTIQVDDNFQVITNGIKDFSFALNTDTNNFEIKYKDGVKEILSLVDEVNAPNMYYITRLQEETGHYLTFGYQTRETVVVLEEVVEMEDSARNMERKKKTLIKFEWRENGVDLFVFPESTGFASGIHFELDDETGLLHRCASHEFQNILYEFEYEKYEEEENILFLITRVKNTERFIEEITYNARLKLPAGGPYKEIPAVSVYYITMYAPDSGVDGEITIKTYTERHDYEYDDVTENGYNFMGYEEGANWDPEVWDNVYLRDASYEYKTYEFVFLSDYYQYIITRKYNKFHLQIEEIISTDEGEDSKQIQHAYSYYADTNTTYEEQDPQYQYLKRKETTYMDGSKNRSEVVNYEYDQYGNVLLIDREGAEKEKYRYAEANKDGFVRYVIRKDEYKYDENNSYRTEYAYEQISSLDESEEFRLIERTIEGKVIDGEMQECKKNIYLYHLDYSEPLTYGLIYRKSTYLSSNYVYSEYSEYEVSTEEKEAVVIKMRKETADSKKTHTQRHISENTGATLLEVDSENAKMRYTYDALNRIISITTGVGSEEYEATTVYEYGLEDTVLIVTETAPDNMVKKTYLDGLNNEVLIKFGENQRVIAKSYFNTISQLLEEHAYDYELLSFEGEEINIDIYNKYEYDPFGKLIRIEHNNGVIYHANYDMIAEKLTEYLEYSHETNEVSKHICTYDRFGNVQLEEFVLESKDTEFKSRENLKKIIYSYDDFNNIHTETIWIQNSEFGALEKIYEYDCFNRITSIRECWGEEGQNELNERTFRYEYSPYSESLLQTAIYVNDKLMGTREYDRLERLEKEQVGTNHPRMYQYNEGAFKPKQMITPREEVIHFQYVKELNSKPTSVRVEGKRMRYSYEYDPRTSLVTKQENNSTLREITYDRNRNVSNERLEINKHEYNNAYVYAEFGTLKLIEKMTGEQIEYRYNQSGQAIGFIEGDVEVKMTYTNDFPLEIRMTGESNEAFISKFTYDAMGRERKREFICENEKIGHISSAYNSAGKIYFKEIDFGEEYVRCNYCYDIFGKIISAEMEGTSFPRDMFGDEIKGLGYRYDEFDNITHVETSYVEGDTRTTIFMYDEHSPCKLIKVKNLTSHDEELDIKYDEGGNIIFDGMKDYTYDPFGKLVSAAASAEDMSIYTDDFVGRKYMQNFTQTETATTTFYDKDNKLMQSITNNEHMETDIEKMDFIEVNDQISYITSEKDGKRRQHGLLNDLNGSNYAWVNVNDCKEKGSLKVYTPYGLTHINDQLPIQFTGEFFDAHTGLYHLGNRAYSPLLMRFLQQDEASPFDEGGPNPYLYPGDPISFTDPHGNISTWAAVGIGLGVAGLLFSAFTFGLGAVAVGGVLAFVKTTAGVLAATSLVLETASLATGIAAAVTEESDPETSRQLSVASGILGLGSFITGIGSTIKAAPSLIGKFKAENMISGAVDSIDFIGTSNGGKTMKYLFSANYKGGSLLVTHGVPSEKLIKSFTGLSVTGQRIAPELRELYRISTLAGEATGPLYLMSCGAAKLGKASNAQKIATALNREVVVFPNRYTWSLKGLSPVSAGDTLSFVGWGWPPFSKFLTLTP